MIRYTLSLSPLNFFRYFDLVQTFNELQRTCQRQVIRDQAPADTATTDVATKVSCQDELDQIAELQGSVTDCEKKIEARDNDDSRCAADLEICKKATGNIDQIRELHQHVGTLSDEAGVEMSQNLSITNSKLVTQGAVCLEQLELEIQRSAALEEVAFESRIKANESDHNRKNTQEVLAKCVSREAACLSNLDLCTTGQATCEATNAHLTSSVSTCKADGQACRLSLSVSEETVTTLTSAAQTFDTRMQRCEDKVEALTIKENTFLSLKDGFADLQERYQLLDISCKKGGLTDIHLSDTQLAGQTLLRNPGLFTIFILMVLGDVGFLLVAILATIRYCRRPIEPRPASPVNLPLQERPSAPPAQNETA